MKNTFVTISDPKSNKNVDPKTIVDGIFVQSKNNEDSVSLMFTAEEKASLFGDKYAADRTRVAFKMGNLDTMRNLVQENNLKVGSEVAGKIIVKESITPFYHDQQPKINPTTDAIINSGGQPVYRKSFLAMNDSEEIDVLLISDSVGQQLERKIADLETVSAEMG